MQPLFKPGDQKIYRSPGDVRHPRALAFVFVILSLIMIAVGVFWLFNGQLPMAIVLILGGVAVAVIALYREISDALMQRRMRKRE